MSIPEAMQRAYAHWNAGQADQAEMLCQRVLAVWPGHADALHLMGVMAHAYGNLDLAITQLRQACQAPRAPAVYFSNLAEMCRQKGLLLEGEQAGLRAVALDPALVAAWNNLGILQQELGKLEQSVNSLERVAALKPDWAEAHNNLANTYKRLGNLDRAETHYMQALKLNPAYAEAHSNLAFLLNARGQFDRAASEARHAIELNPRLMDAYLNLAEVETSRLRNVEALRWLDALLAFAPQHPPALAARAKALRQQERLDEALSYARQALVLAPDSADVNNTLGQILQALGQHEEALRQFDQAAALPGAVAEEALVGRASLFVEMGRKEEALAAFDQALAAFPQSVRILASRSDSKTFVAGDADIAAMEAVLKQGETRPLTERMAIHFALGKAYLDLGDSDRAFLHLDQGNHLKRSTFNYDATATGTWFRQIAASFSAAQLQRFPGAGAVSELPVFIIGMPRSGTTLLEQILASHPQVHGAGELTALRMVVEGLGHYPADVAHLGAGDLTRLGENYLGRVQGLAQGKVRLLDKMPANFFYAGLIPMILPGARIIHCRRDAVDTCLSCYTKQFAGEQLFSYEQSELGQFYRDYQQLMAHWRQILPAQQFIEVDYESVVDDLETQARRLLAFLDLPWDAACLNFHETRRVVRTASVNQVRKPIYTSAKNRWQAHAAHLGPLLAALGVSAP
jgi:tetratricopeptide (TPR) repeat protein